MKVSAILPAYGRHAQTIDLIPRLLGSAGLAANEWELIVVSNGQAELTTQLQGVRGIRILSSKTNLGYWGALKVATLKSTSPIICNLANDLLPGYDWLKRALDAYELTYGEGEGLMGINDSLRLDQSAHFLIARSMLHRWYGEEYWPTHYRHSFGDSEISARAKSERKFAIAPFSVLMHFAHPMVGGDLDDVYRLGSDSFEQDEAMFEMRKANKWGALAIARGA